MDYPSEVGRLGVRTEHLLPDVPERVLQVLSKSEVFSCCELSQLAEVAGLALLQRIARRRRLYGKGEPVAGLYVVGSGRVRVVRDAGEARALTVAYREEGDVVGEIAVTQRDRHEDTATVIDPAEVVQIPLRGLEGLMARNAELARRLLGLMVERRLETERRIESLLCRTVEARVAEFVLDAAQRHGVPDARGLMIGIKYTHQEIADYVGSTRETVTLTLGELKRRNLLLFDHRRIVVRDAEGLGRAVQ
ncbi:MAG: global nitrogen regulatory protein family of transcriptional regulator [Pseudomonadota bacterium]|jgi:CRP-like cAMP-binding protein